MTSILKVDNIQNTSGTGSPYITDAVLQVRYFQLTEPQNETYSSGDTDQVISNFNINITPVSTASIIKLEANIMFEWANSSWDHIWFFYRDSTKLGATNAGSRRAGISPSTVSHGKIDPPNSDSTPEFATLTYFDAPSSTSQINYKLGVNASGTNNLFINRTVGDSNNVGYERGVSFISATEIGR
tara:strand:- start:2072 stop:2626 length:555 start_codon:yes stop_codon:yes gene_type:complete